ncbi:hypothetical protein BSKO_11746 [Bryopsis sp. KO-2023]|nr:hypothetical protein BSKO_11746 [Bryopsis sp. KO-2023]
MAAGNQSAEGKPEPVGCVASLLSCFRRTKKSIGSDKESSASRKRHRGGKESGALELTVDAIVGTREALPQRDETQSSVAELIEKIFIEIKDVPWTALEAKILLYRTLAQQEADTISQESFENFKACSPQGDQVEQLSCVYVTLKGYFLKNSENADRGEFMVVPQLSESMRTTLVNSIVERGYDASIDVYNMRKGLRDTVDIPCLLVKW